MQVHSFIRRPAPSGAAKGLALALAFIGAGAAATEVRDFPIPPSVLTRAQVQAEIAQAQREARVISLGEATEFPLPAAQPKSGRAEAAREMRRAAAQPVHDIRHYGG